MTSPFDDLLSANEHFAQSFPHADVQGVARAGVAVVTCMDARIPPLEMLGLRLGDAKVVRNPGGRVTPVAMEALVLAVNLLGVNRILVVPHTRCAMASSTQEEMRARVAESSGGDTSEVTFSVVDDQRAALVKDVEAVRHHPLVPSSVAVGGFVYDVDTGRLEQVV
ncbi:MAG TPA: carbonic anhydrase [Nocardioidaceae bacterium]|nr:carbonic anhydrase [Nocardioidaceae bacterium]